ncbi:hypothetical protein AMAG_11417 [Allomyces macrogynus ATCC 38327]|uniref:Secreted protein n=1 Tax=Allomyces macrogynus (strain ATCC 38327) TaxID=578462 RepID=A0A0L0SWQ6_ALLM3|nr:hypothetical protein AMAG_11417 [Allomyces macrogynus ATCC 38327]|eukprot:KNE66942.1 hypothetical protein AMAG_11417 [Allomyces macrogynus ATCC 38327]
MARDARLRTAVVFCLFLFDAQLPFAFRLCPLAELAHLLSPRNVPFRSIRACSISTRRCPMSKPNVIRMHLCVVSTHFRHEMIGAIGAVPCCQHHDQARSVPRIPIAPTIARTRNRDKAFNFLNY